MSETQKKSGVVPILWVTKMYTGMWDLGETIKYKMVRSEAFIAKKSVWVYAQEVHS